MRILVTGAAGFVGQHLVAHLQGHEIYGTWIGPRPGSDLGIEWISCDLCDPAATRRAVDRALPEAVYHLAAFSSVKDSFEQERRVYDVNFYGTLNLLSSLAGARTKARVLMVSSGQVYGQGSSILTEQSLLCPRTPYAVSKAAAEFLAVRFWNANSLETIRVRPFNHVGPGQSAAFVCSDFARQVAEIELGLRTPEIYVGNLSVKRDFTDVRDVCRAYVLLLSNGIPGEVYNLASGRVSTIATILEILRTFCSCQIRVVKTGAKLRTAEIIELKASAAKMQALTGWEPGYTLETTLRDLYTWWLAKLKHQRPAAVLP